MLWSGLLFFPLFFLPLYLVRILSLAFDSVGVLGACCDVLCSVYSRIRLSVNTRVVSWAITRRPVRSIARVSIGVISIGLFYNQASF